MKDQDRPETAGSSPAGAKDLAAERRKGLFVRAALRMRAKAELVLPAAPSLAGHFTDLLADHFAALGRPFSAAELLVLRNNLHDKLSEALATSPTSTVFVRYHTVGEGSLRIEYGIASAAQSTAEQYEHWVETREPPLFGTHADARVLDLLADVPAGAPCLDIGAGTGRNSLALARRGYVVDAVEPVPGLAAVIEAEAAKEKLPVRIVSADVLRGPLPVEAGHYGLAVASQLTSHFRGAGELRALFRAISAALAPAGQALATVFLTADGYRPDRIAREMAQVFWTAFFTPEDLEQALTGLPLETVSNEDALAYERGHQPAGSWPPTSWFEGWARGEDVFGGQSKPPIELRWVRFKRLRGPVPAV
jgi:SAM-dependent methyltransferase